MRRIHHFTLIILILVLGFGLGLGSNLSTSRASLNGTSPITLTDQQVESNFRQNFIFRAKATSTAGDIVRARIFFTPRVNGEEQIDFLYPKSGKSADLTYTWDTTFETTPPFQVLIYHWEIIDSVGNIYDSDPVTTEISDSTQDWQMLKNGNVRVYWYGRDQAFGEDLLAQAERGYERVSAATGYKPKQELRIALYPNHKEFCLFWAPGYCQQFIAGVTFGIETVQWFNKDDPRFVLRQVVPHELAHAFLEDWLGARVDEIPRWFNEGQAVNNELEKVDEQITIARDLASKGKLQRLFLMESFTAPGYSQEESISNWYAQATSLVNFLYTRWGADSLGKIARMVKDGTKFEDAFTGITGMSMDDYEQAWRTWLDAPDKVAPPAALPTNPPPRPTPTFRVPGKK